MKKFLIKTTKIIWNVLKHILLLPMYCSMSDKYSGTTYDEWLKNNKL